MCPFPVAAKVPKRVPLGCGTKLELEPNGVFELPVEIVLQWSDEWDQREV